MAERKAYLLRIDPAVWVEVERLAQRELRSVNAQIEFLLRDALAQRGVAPASGPRNGHPPATPQPDSPDTL